METRHFLLTVNLKLVLMGVGLSLGAVACGMDPSADAGEQLGQTAEAQILAPSSEGFYAATDQGSPRPIYALYSIYDWRFNQGAYYCHVSDYGQLHALAITYNFAASSDWDTFTDIVSDIHAQGGNGTLDFCGWPSGMIGRLEADGQTAVYLTLFANYKTFGNMCWIKNEAQVAQHGGWGRVWIDRNVLRWDTAHIELTTIHGSCGANGPNCYNHIPACADNLPF